MRAGVLALSCALLASGCSKLPGKPAPGPEVPRPESVLSSKVLYAQNCAGCHGADGLHGPSTPLASPVYQALVDDARIRQRGLAGVAGFDDAAISRAVRWRPDGCADRIARARHTRELAQRECTGRRDAATLRG